MAQTAQKIVHFCGNCAFSRSTHSYLGGIKTKYAFCTHPGMGPGLGDGRIPLPTFHSPIPQNCPLRHADISVRHSLAEEVRHPRPLEGGTDRLSETPERFRITFTDSGYKVNIPRYQGGEVVRAEVYDQLLRKYQELQQTQSGPSLDQIERAIAAGSGEWAYGRLRQLTPEQEEHIREAALEEFAIDSRNDPYYAASTLKHLAEKAGVDTRFWLEILTTDSDLWEELLGFNPLEDE